MPASKQAIVRYARRLTEHPQGIQAADVGSLREQGLSDPVILHVNLIVGYFNMVNRISEGLGVELEREDRRHPGTH